jgi:hypothetical protein
MLLIGEMTGLSRQFIASGVSSNSIPGSRGNIFWLSCYPRSVVDEQGHNCKVS